MIISPIAEDRKARASGLSVAVERILSVLPVVTFRKSVVPPTIFAMSRTVAVKYMGSALAVLRVTAVVHMLTAYG